MMSKMTSCTVKASDFAPHGKIVVLYQKGFLSSKLKPTRYDRNGKFRKTLTLQTW
jgi:hypothetical protein